MWWQSILQISLHLLVQRIIASSVIFHFHTSTYQDVFPFRSVATNQIWSQCIILQYSHVLGASNTKRDKRKTVHGTPAQITYMCNKDHRLCSVIFQLWSTGTCNDDVCPYQWQKQPQLTISLFCLKSHCSIIVYSLHFIVASSTKPLYFCHFLQYILVWTVCCCNPCLQLCSHRKDTGIIYIVELFVWGRIIHVT